MIHNLTGRYITCYNCEGNFVILEPVDFISERGAYYIVNENMVSTILKRGIARDKILIASLPEIGRDKVMVRRLWQIGEKASRIIPIGE